MSSGTAIVEVDDSVAVGIALMVLDAGICIFDGVKKIGGLIELYGQCRAGQTAKYVVERSIKVWVKIGKREIDLQMHIHLWSSKVNFNLCKEHLDLMQMFPRGECEGY